jgi:hypothetical protein
MRRADIVVAAAGGKWKLGDLADEETVEQVSLASASFVADGGDGVEEAAAGAEHEEYE